MDDEAADLPSRVGMRLRAARGTQELSLRSLARATGFSASFLSQVERGQVSPLLASLQRIAHELGLSLASLVAASDSAEDSVRVRRRGEGALRTDWSHASVESLAGGESGLGLEPLWVTLEPDGETGPVHASARSGLWVCTRGEIVMRVGARRVVLAAGDSVAYGPDVSPTWVNESSEVAEVILVCAPARGG